MGETINESMNQELKDWIKETRQIPQDENKSDQSQNNPQGKCMICGQKDAKFFCIKCEQSV